MGLKKAFTMIELVFVIVVIGIIAAIALPRFESDNVQEAMDQILSDVRYTQHLALVDNVIDPTNGSWQSAFWTIQFRNTIDGSGDWAYTIASDISDHNGNFSKTEAAVDPRDGRLIYGNTDNSDTDVSKKVFLTDRFGITNVNFNTSCNVQTGSTGTNNSQHIGFDSFGRPHKGHLGSTSPNYSSIMQGNCTIIFTFSGGETAQITINKETGYAFVVGQTDQ